MAQKRRMADALAETINDEQEAVRKRFEKADEAMAGKTKQKPKTIQQEAEKVIRDTFSLPSSDYELIAAIRGKCLKSAVSVTKSEVIRAGLHALLELSDRELLVIFDGLTKVKPGRPKAA